MLKTSLKELTSLGLSRDGNWIAFSAKDQNGKDDVYWMNIAGGKASRITEEFSAHIGGADPSPDASQVAYACLDELTGNYRVKLVATQGGGSRTLADTGVGPIWRPDGERIGYIRMGRSGGFQSVSGGLEIWSVKPDGTDKHLELIDTVAARPSPWAFCWSPDGGSVAWVRTYPGDYAELMMRELQSGRERQLTFDKRNINDVTWATNDMIFFPSNRSGANNLWTIPAVGGEATQVTQGGVPVREARISNDNRTLVFRQMELAYHIWSSALDGSNAREVSVNDVRVIDVRSSPDGKYIAHVTGDVDFSNPEAHLYVMDRDGKNQRQLTSGPNVVSSCGWSPDGKYLAYASRAVGEPNDSTKVFLVQPFNPGTPRPLCAGRLFDWVDGERIVSYHNGRTLLYPVNGGPPIQVYEDSTFARPLQGGTQFVFLDYRRGREGWWIVSADGTGKAAGMARKLFPASADYAWHPDWRFMIYMKQNNEIWQVWTSTGKEHRIGTALPRLWPWDVSWDGREILWLEELNPSKLVLVKNVFE
jgi:Tol biopolymer transport system component